MKNKAHHKHPKETKFRETVRDRDVRRSMKGQACFRCQKFYEILNVDNAEEEA
jgi:hypothetical protein